MEINKKRVYQLIVFASFVIYAIFPIVNYFRRQFTDWVLFDAWRDYLFYAAAINLAACLIFNFDEIEKLENRIRERKIKMKFPVMLFALLIVWMLVSTSVNGFTMLSVIGTEKSRTGLISNICYISFLFFGLFLKDEKLKKSFLIIFEAVGSAVLAILVLGYAVLGTGNTIVYEGQIFYNNNHFAYYALCVCVAGMLLFLLDPDKKQRVFFAAASGLGVCGLVILNTLGAWAALLVCLPFTAMVLLLTGKFDIKRFVCILCVLALCVCAVVLVSRAKNDEIWQYFNSYKYDMKDNISSLGNMSEVDSSLGTGRLGLWRTSVKCISERPLFGYGLEQMRNRLAAENPTDSVHNEFLEYAGNYGLPALLLYVSGILSVYIRGLKNRRNLSQTNIVSLCAAFAYLVSSFTGVTMFYTAPYLFIFLAFGFF